MRRFIKTALPNGCCTTDNAAATTTQDETMLCREILDRLGKKSSNNNSTELLQREEDEIIETCMHIRQDETWDCGLTCIQMVLQWARRAKNDTDLDNTFDANAVEEVNTTLRINEQSIATDDDQLHIEKAWMVEFVETKSIWTIDLVMILQHIISEGIPSELSNNKQTANRSAESEEECSSQHGQQQQYISSLSYLFCSTKFGVDETYHNISYYEDSFSSDELRVRSLFGIAEKQCLPMLETSNLSIQVLVDIVSRKDVVAIVLLDNRILKYNNNTNDTTSSSSYSGHYVVLCGISRDEHDIRCALLKKMSSSSSEENRDGGDGDNNSNFCMVVKNPGSWKQVEFISPSIFEMAWKAKGTDQDVIFIAK